MAIDKDIIDKLIGEAKTSEDLFGRDGLFKQLQKQLIDRMLDAELTHHLGYEPYSYEGHHTGNTRNGKTQKKVKTGSGELSVDVPRDREGSFEPHLIKKRQRRLSELDDAILSLYSRGMTVRDIEEHLRELYGTLVSRELISTVTDAVIEEVKGFRNRPLDKLYPIIFIDGFVVKCRLDGHVCNRAVYVVLGINLQGEKEVLGLYLGETESAKYWLSVLTELKNRGLEDVYILCADGLTGLPDAVEAVLPETIFQSCIIHMVRNSLNHVPHKDKKAVSTSLKAIYKADTVESAERALEQLDSDWGGRYAIVVRSWRNNWERIIPFFDFPADIRRVIYTTNAIESLNRTLRKAIKNRGHFTTEDAVMKVLYLSIKNASKNWTMPIQNWTQALNQFAIRFEDRFPKTLDF